MFPSSSSSSTQEFLHIIHNRRLLLHSPFFYHTPPPSVANPPSPTQTDATLDAYTTPSNGFDANVVMVLSVLLCALFCSLGLNSIIRCALKCSSLIRNNTNNDEIDNRRVNSVALAKTGGVRKKALKTFPTVNYSDDLNLPVLDSECVICLSEFFNGERIRLLPKCNHGFHVRCIDRWLDSHSSCPTCRSCLVDTCKKIVGCDQASSSETQEITVNVTPLEREDIIRSYRSTTVVAN